MWGTRIFDGLESLLKRTSDVFNVTSEVAGSGSDRSPGRFTGEGFEQHEVLTEYGKARIFVTGRTMASYFEDVEEYSPTIVSVQGESYACRPRRTVADTSVGGSPADLFINAIRKPTRTITEDLEPVIIKKERIFPAPEPVISASVETPVVQIAEVSVEPVALEGTVPVSEPVVSVPTTESELTIEDAEIERAEIIESVVDSEIMQSESVTKDVADVCEEVIETVPESPVTLILPASTKVVLALPPKIEIGLLPAASAEPEEVVEGTGPVVAKMSLPTAAVEIEELEPLSSEETQIIDFTDLYPAAEATPTSAGGVMEKPVEDILLDTGTVTEEFVVDDLDRDVLMAFVPGLKEESEEFICTTMESNSDYPEDDLDRTECTFKLKTRRKYPMFDGYMRHIANH